MTVAEGEPEDVAVPLVWVGLDDLPVLASNQLVTQADADGVHLVFGYVTAPVILGDSQRQQELMRQVEFVAVRPLVRLAVSRRRLGEFIEVLQTTAENYDKLHEGES